MAPVCAHCSLAFALPTPLTSSSPLRARHLSSRRISPRACAPEPPRFRARDSDKPQNSFSAPSAAPTTPNARVLAQVRASMDRLGVADLSAPGSYVSKAPKPRAPVDISRVNPLSAFFGSVGAGVMCYAAWHVLTGTVAFYTEHPFESNYYVLVRINAVVRTVLVGIFALASGITGVTSLGLFLLGGRTTAAFFTGEFKEKEIGEVRKKVSADGEGE